MKKGHNLNVIWCFQERKEKVSCAVIFEAHCNKLKEAFDSRLCHHPSNTGVLDLSIKDKMSWCPLGFPVSDLLSQPSKPCTAHLSEFAKTSPCLAFLLCTQTGLVVRQDLCPPSQIPVLLPMLGAWAKMRMPNLENDLILEDLFLFRMSFKDAAQSCTFGLVFLFGWSVETVDIFHNAE